MKNVAVLGCSHSSWRTNDRVWPIQLAERYPNLNIMSFAQPGHGHYHMDLALKHLMYESDVKIDWTIVQFSGLHRIQMPVQCNVPDQDNLWEQCIPDDAGVVPNYKEYVCATARRHRVDSVGVDQVTDFGNLSANGVMGNEYAGHHYIDGAFTEAQYFTRLFLKQIMDMSKYMPLSCFTVWDQGYPNVDNLGMKQTFKQYLEDLVSHGPNDTIHQYLDDTLHLTEEGNKLLVNKLVSLPLFNQHLC